MLCDHFFLSLAYVFTRLALQYFSPFPLGFLRYFAASCALLAVVLAAHMKPPAKGDAVWFLLAGATGFFLYMLTFNTGSRTVTARRAAWSSRRRRSHAFLHALFIAKAQRGAVCGHRGILLAS
jgi:hypothetical protein